MSVTPTAPSKYGTELAPEAPPGQWQATCHVTKTGRTREKGTPSVYLNWELTESLTDGNESFVGTKVFAMIRFQERTSPQYRQDTQDLRALCTALQVALPDLSSLEESPDNFTSLQPFIDAINGAKTVIWTMTQIDKRTGEPSTKVRFSPGR